jgi:chromosome partitioning protein
VLTGCAIAGTLAAFTKYCLVEYHKMTRVIAVANQKGGVGKTTTAINLAAGIALSGHATLLVDIDPQGNATSGVGMKQRAAENGSVYDALMAEDPAVAAERFVIASGVERLSLVPATRELTGAELELISVPNRERRLKQFIDAVKDRFEYVVIDCPPSLGLLTLNGLVAADTVLIPLHCEYFALEGLADLVGTMRRVRAAYNPTLEIEGVLLTMYDERTNLGQQVARDVREFFKDKVFRTVIPRNVRLGEAPSHGVPGVVYDARSRGAEAYFALAHEVITRHYDQTAA